MLFFLFEFSSSLFASDKDNLSGSEDDQTQFPHSQGTTQVQKKHRRSDKVPSVTKEDRGHKLKNVSRQKQGSRRVSRDSSDLTPDSDAELQDSGSNMAPSTRGNNKKKVQKKRQQSDADSDDEEYDEDSSEVPKHMPQVDPATLPQLLQMYAAMQGQAKGKSSSSKASAPETIITYAGFPQKGDDSDPIPKLIREAIKDVVWRTKKFVTSEAQEVALARDVYAAIEIKDKGAEGHEEAFIERYRSKCTELLNGQRSYVQANAKAAANDWMADNNGILPEVAEIKACLSRYAPPEGEEALARWKKVWVWYWDVYVPFIAGNKFHWNESKRHYECMSESAVVGSGDVKPSAAKKAKKAGKKTPEVALNVPPSTEAYAVVMFENCRTKWMEEYPVKHGPSGEDQPAKEAKSWS